MIVGRRRVYDNTNAINVDELLNPTSRDDKSFMGRADRERSANRWAGAVNEIRLDDVDRRLIKELVRDGRQSMLALAQRAHVSRTHVYARIERLEKAGVIEGFAARINMEKAGFGTSALIALTIQQNSWRALAEQLRTLDYVERFTLLGGDFDVLVVVRAPDNQTLRDVVLERIHGFPGIRSSRTWLVFEEWNDTIRGWL